MQEILETYPAGQLRIFCLTWNMGAENPPGCSCQHHKTPGITNLILDDWPHVACYEV